MKIYKIMFIIIFLTNSIALKAESLESTHIYSPKVSWATLKKDSVGKKDWITTQSFTYRNIFTWNINWTWKFQAANEIIAEHFSFPDIYADEITLLEPAKALDFVFLEPSYKWRFYSLDEEIQRGYFSRTRIHADEFAFYGTGMFPGENSSWSWKLRVGRQSISYGSAIFYNVSDIFMPLSAESRNTGYKAGMDALMAKIYWKDKLEIGFISTGHEESFKKGAHLIDMAFHTQIVRASLYAGTAEEYPVMGWDLSGNIWDQSWFIEGFSALMTQDKKKDHLQVSAGLYGQISSDLSYRQEFMGNKEEKQSEIISINKDTYFFKEYLGSWYSGSSLTWNISPLYQNSLYLKSNLSDNSFLLLSQLIYNASEQTEIIGSASYTEGKKDTEMGNYLSPKYAFDFQMKFIY